MSARETAPGVLHDMAVGIGTDIDTDELVDGDVEGGIAAGEEVRAGSADGVLEDVRQEGGEDEGDGEAEERHVEFVRRGTESGGPEHEQGEGEGGGVDEEPDWRLCGLVGWER